MTERGGSLLGRRLVIGAWLAFIVVTFLSARPGVRELLSIPVFVTVGYLGLQWVGRREGRKGVARIGRTGVSVFGALPPDSAARLMAVDSAIPEPAARALDPVNGHSAALIANPGTLELWRLDMGNEDPHLARRWTGDEIVAMSPAGATYRGWPRAGIKIELAGDASFVFVPIDGVLSRRRFAVESIERLKAGMAGNQR